MSARRHERTSARRSAVQVLYTSELQEERPSILLETGRCLKDDGPLSDYALKLVKGVEEHCADIDRQLESTSENWAVSRMPIVDRSILRLAAFEMIYVDDVPVSVSINEAVELAKDFGGEDESPRFVNGVLGRIARKLEAEASDAEAAADDAAEAAPAEATSPEEAPEAAAGEGAEGAEQDAQDAPADGGEQRQDGES